MDEQRAEKEPDGQLRALQTRFERFRDSELSKYEAARQKLTRERDEARETVTANVDAMAELTRQRDEARRHSQANAHMAAAELSRREAVEQRADKADAEVERLRKAAKAYLHAGGNVYEAAWPDGDLSRLDLAPDDTAEALEGRYLGAEGTLSRALLEADRG